nr:chemotaxis protein CheW [Pirellulales bacterium]
GGVEDATRGIVVVLEAGHDCRGLLVDDLAGKQEVVIKSLGETFAGRTAFAGAAILGDGRVGLILDTTALVRLGRRSTETAA